MTADLNELLNYYINSQFIVCNRNNGYITPTTMKIVNFDSAIANITMWSAYSKTLYLRHFGFYIILPDGSTKNIHHGLRRLLRAGLLELVEGEADKYGRGTRHLRIKK